MEQLKTESKEPIQEPRKLFLEIGTNQIPVTLFGTRSFKNDIYIGIDINKEAVKEAREVTLLNKERGNFYFLNADAQNLPIKDKSMDEVFVGNVLGYRRISHKIQDLFLKEIARALKDGGLLIIKETNTPEEAEIERVEKMLTENGFKMEKILSKKSPEWLRVLRTYQGWGTSNLDRDSSYILFAKKL